ncbi:LAME_0G06546g1_1 [Lachancea meyersii CBS 8951]|uniref:2-dehydropantoate 2-reductase n=1 Tax=Lachancea meyersii CBS 8951 TaxID=1266667 RepID=A0A1G4K7P5_9SACH|nr:LAME_0G06546g1_1 [Lachancea meyersii CBS 8951]
MTQAQQKVFVLGFGSIGVLLASQLQQNARVSVVPLFRSEKRLQDFGDSERKVSVKCTYDEGVSIRENVYNGATCPELFPKDGKIDNLIITTKTYQTKDALAPYMKYIHPQTNVMLVQNGLGVLEVLKDEVFVDFRPNLFQGVISHGVYQTTGFSFTHAGFGDLKISRLPGADSDSIVQSNKFIGNDKESNSLLELFTQPDFTKGLNVVHMTYQEMLLGQLEKYMVNTCMNSVTSILDCINGELIDVAAPTFDAIIAESLAVLKAAYKPLFDYKPESEDYPDIDLSRVLDPVKLRDFIIWVACDKAGGNSSSMRQDTVNLRETEVEYLNGYIVKLCKELNLGPEHCKINQTLVDLVKLRLELNRYRDKHGDMRLQ